jgi:predicted alpha/beta-hydrolase family hydrolase
MERKFDSLFVVLFAVVMAYLIYKGWQIAKFELEYVNSDPNTPWIFQPPVEQHFEHLQDSNDQLHP